MTHKCELIEDLLPLYIEDACSGESGRIIKEHLEECPQCRRLLHRLGRDTFSRPEEPGVEEVLKRTSYILSKRAVYSALGVLAVVIYWVVYFWQDYWSAMGDYRFFSYSFHEMYTIGLLIVPASTVIWLTALLVKSLRNRSWKKNLAMLMVLLVLVLGQTGYFIRRDGTWSSYSWTQIMDVPDNSHVVIRRADGTLITLETSVQVAHLVEEMGPVYQIGYEWNERSPGEGILTYIEVTDIQPEDAKP